VDERVLRCARTPGKLGAPRLAEAGFSRLKGPPRALSETAGRSFRATLRDTFV